MYWEVNKLKMKTLIFYEVNELGPLSTRLPTLSDNANQVFDVINNLGAATRHCLVHKLTGLSTAEVDSGLSDLLHYNLITRRNVSAHDNE